MAGRATEKATVQTLKKIRHKALARSVHDAVQPVADGGQAALTPALRPGFSGGAERIKAVTYESDCDICELAQELMKRLIGVGAMISEARRAALATGLLSEDLRAVDKAFQAPLLVARQLSRAVHQKCDVTLPPTRRISRNAEGDTSPGTPWALSRIAAASAHP
jgi:hypothetical protein